jgi:hypothetical protein
MKAIVIVFIRPRERPLLLEQPLGGHLETGQENSSRQSESAGLNETSRRDEMTLPFWTWFIENPRRCGA